MYAPDIKNMATNDAKEMANKSSAWEYILAGSSILGTSRGILELSSPWCWIPNKRVPSPCKHHMSSEKSKKAMFYKERDFYVKSETMCQNESDISNSMKAWENIFLVILLFINTNN